MDVYRANENSISRCCKMISIPNGVIESVVIGSFLYGLGSYAFYSYMQNSNSVFPNSLYQDGSALIKEKEKCNHIFLTTTACLALADNLVNKCMSKFDTTCEKANKEFIDFLAEAKSFEDLPIYPCTTKILYFDKACHDKWVDIQKYDHWKTHLQKIGEFKEFMKIQLPLYEQIENTCSKLSSPSIRVRCNLQGDGKIKACAGAPASQTCIQEKLIFERFLDTHGIIRNPWVFN